MDKALDEKARVARVRVHETAHDLQEAHRAFILAAERHGEALKVYIQANDAIVADNLRVTTSVADAFELAAASDSVARLKAQREL